MNGNRNLPNNSDGRAERPRKELTERDVFRRSTGRYRHRRPSHSGVLLLICMLLFALLLIFCAYLIANREDTSALHREGIADEITSTENASTSESDSTLELEEIGIPSSDVGRGNLILVNYEYEYTFPEDDSHLESIYANKSDYYKVAYTDYLLDKTALGSFNRLMAALAKATGDRCILVNSSYRTLSEQEEIYRSYVESSGEEYAAKYVADPGKSEHHTGLALDLTVRYDDGTSVLMANYENLSVLNELCTQYGFIRRYPDNKYNYTHINTEPWHYRYVGTPHAQIIESLGFCLEQYIEYLRSYTVDGHVMTFDTQTGALGESEISKLPSGVCAIYFAEASDTDTTYIKIPAGASSYDISGNNADGFIITATLE